jgi:hypothetical protein
MVNHSILFTNKCGGVQYPSFLLFECRNSKTSKKMFKEFITVADVAIFYSKCEVEDIPN